ncbi:MAG: DNA-processing protein DprA [Blautia sp.]|nr:DNA-processing protein DprA [Blautia sp.]
MEGTDTIRCIEKTDQEYPDKIKNYPSMPEKIYVKGSLPSPDLPTVAVVGARMCSPYGRLQAFRYAKELSMAGVQIISGMALGIDSEGHKGALEGKMPTFAVLGNGVDICYPAGNRRLYERILWENGGIISEYPPGFTARKWCFPARNRLISALCDAVLVVEAKENSGSLITAGFALEQGKMVFAIPGSVDDSLSMGCHKLIYDGAGIAYKPEIVLEELGIRPGEKTKTEGKNNLGLASDLNMVYSCLDLRPKNKDYIMRKTGFSLPEISNCLVELMLMGLVRESGRHYYVRNNI